VKFFNQYSSRDAIHLIPRWIIVIIIGQTLPYKYLGAEESVWIFSQLGWEPWGRYLIAILETVAIVLLLSRWYVAGAIITFSLISSANLMHFLRLGIEVNKDGGLLFIYSIVVVAASLVILIYWNRRPRKKGLSDMAKSISRYSQQE
jgi:hypothetical protein